jgi:hypothetical protein
LEIVEFPLEARPFPLFKFLFLDKGIFVQLAAIFIDLETRKGGENVIG